MDPATLYAIGQIGGFVSDAMSQDKANKANAEMMKIIEETAGKFLDTSEDMFSIANYFQPGGGAFRDAKQTSIDTAFMTAQKGSEDLMSKGVNMTSYGMGTAADIVKDSFTKNLMSDYKQLSSIGQGYAGLGMDALKSYGDYMTTGAQADYMNTANQPNPLDSLFGQLSDLDTATAISSLFGDSGNSMNFVPGGEAAYNQIINEGYEIPEDLEIPGYEGGGG